MWYGRSIYTFPYIALLPIEPLTQNPPGMIFSCAATLYFQLFLFVWVFVFVKVRTKLNKTKLTEPNLTKPYQLSKPH